MTIAFTKVKLPYGWLGNMSPYPVIYEGLEYRTTEALFQALRFKDHPEIQALIREQKSPMAAKMVAKSHRDFMQSTEETDMEIMKLCLRLKIDQHPELKQQLVDTGDELIVEDCTSRDRGSARYWGAVLVNGEWQGKNLLGQLWMDLRKLGPYQD